MAVKIEIAPYDPAWATAFEEASRQLADQLAPLPLQVEHIGSTAVEGLSAKPIIDIMLGLEEEGTLDVVVEPLLSLGYCYYRCYEPRIPGRRFFARLDALQRQVFDDIGQLPTPEEFPHTHHIHVVVHGSLWWKRHLAFRDYLRAHSMARDAYHRMKLKLASGTWERTEDYAEAKTGFIRGIERLIELTG